MTERQGEKKKGRKVAGEMLMSCPVQYPYSSASWVRGRQPRCDARICETVGSTACGSVNLVPCFSRVGIAAHPPIHRQHKHFMFCW